MPVTLKKINGKWRVVEAKTGKLSKSSSGKARDGGGHSSRSKALAQVRAMNMHITK